MKKFKVVKKDGFASTLILLTVILSISLFDHLYAENPVLERSINHILFQPQRICSTEDGVIYVSEPRRNRIRVISADGRILNNYHLQRPLAMCPIQDDLILAGGNNRVDAVNVEGEIVFSLGIGENEFGKPNDIAVSDDGTIYVSDQVRHQIKVYDKFGVHLFNFGAKGSGAGQFIFPTGIAADSRNREIYVVDQGNARVQVFDLSGNFLRAFGEFTCEVNEEWVYEGTFSKINGIAIDGNRRVYIADSYQNNVQVMTHAGEFISFISIDSEGDHIFSLPTDVSVTDSLLYVCSTLSSQVFIFKITDILPPAEEDPPEISNSYSLSQNYPNPFNPLTKIPFSLEESGVVNLDVYDVMGRNVTRLIDQEQFQPGHY